MEVNGWSLFVHPLFQSQLEKLTAIVEKLRLEDPRRYQSHPASKLLATVRRYILETIPRDPNSPEFRQGNTLGTGNRHWFRAKFHDRYRLFYRFSAQHKIIVYALVNDDESLRRARSKTDPYAVFKAMLESGNLPTSFADLLQASSDMR